MKLRVTPLSGLYSRIFNISLISYAPKDVKGMGAVAYRLLEASYTNWVSRLVKIADRRG